jgi:hypothetical protein
MIDYKKMFDTLKEEIEKVLRQDIRIMGSCADEKWFHKKQLREIAQLISLPEFSPAELNGLEYVWDGEIVEVDLWE